MGPLDVIRDIMGSVEDQGGALVTELIFSSNTGEKAIEK